MPVIDYNDTDSGMPEFRKDAFNCPRCGVWAHQFWSDNGEFSFGHNSARARTFTAHISVCQRCRESCLWVDKKMALPDVGGAPRPHSDMPERVKADYAEAASVVQKSPRAAAALLRLTLEKLCTEVGAKGKTLQQKIDSLVKEQGFSRRLVESMDTVRILGNEAVHTGNINLQEDAATVPTLFRLINFIVDKLITEPREIDAINASVPDAKKRNNIPPKNGAGDAAT